MNLDTVGAHAHGGAHAVVGGIEYAVGGWGEYELDRRSVAGGSAAAYRGRTWIGAGDVARSLQRPDSALALAAENLAEAYARYEDRVCSEDWCLAPGGAAVVVPPVTSADLREFAGDPAAHADPETLRQLGRDAAAILGLAQAAALPALPTTAAAPNRVVSVLGSPDAIVEFEDECRPLVRSLEQLQAALADRFEAIAKVLA